MSNCSVQGHVECLAVSNDGKWVVSWSGDGQVQFRDVKTWIVQLVLQGHGEGYTGLLFPFSPTILRLMFRLLQFTQLTTTLVEVS